MDGTGSKGQSYRQVGKAHRGKICRGVPDAAGGETHTRMKRTTASIPSKFDTVLYTGARESNAFGNRCQRFGSRMTSQPGPGAYHNEATLIRDETKCGSVSRLGYSNGFVSRTRRFRDRHDDYDLTPGPGSYNEQTDGSNGGFNRAGTTRIFATPRIFRDEPLRVDDPSPGPGQYNSSAVAQKVRTKPTSSFRSTSKRGFQPLSDAPAPGVYEARGSIAVVAPKLQSATFRSTTQRQSAARRARESVPGPGAYDGRTKAPPRRAPAQNSSMFANAGQDRFGRPYVQKAARDELPGPGKYPVHERGAVNTTRALASSSFFVSDVPRMGGVGGAKSKVVKPPGPAYYKPENVGKPRSFLLNASHKWV